jgi:hypothetical protein
MKYVYIVEFEVPEASYIKGVFSTFEKAVEHVEINKNKAAGREVVWERVQSSMWIADEFRFTITERELDKK